MFAACSYDSRIQWNLPPDHSQKKYHFSALPIRNETTSQIKTSYNSLVGGITSEVKLLHTLNKALIETLILPQQSQGKEAFVMV